MKKFTKLVLDGRGNVVCKSPKRAKAFSKRSYKMKLAGILCLVERSRFVDKHDKIVYSENVS